MLIAVLFIIVKNWKKKKNPYVLQQVNGYTDRGPPAPWYAAQQYRSNHQRDSPGISVMGEKKRKKVNTEKFHTLSIYRTFL